MISDKTNKYKNAIRNNLIKIPSEWASEHTSKAINPKDKKIMAIDCNLSANSIPLCDEVKQLSTFNEKWVIRRITHVFFRRDNY